MYRLKRPTNKQLTDFFTDYGPRIKWLMQQLESGTLTIPLTLGTKHTIHLTLKVQAGSETHQFLTKYSQDVHLRRLLCGDWQEHVSIIHEVSGMIPNLSWQNGMTKGGYLAGQYRIYGRDADGKDVVEDFNEIMYWLFVEQLYEGKDNVVHFDKTDFVKERGMEVCPYCGRQPIDFAEVDGSVSKPYIDHFLPKSKYPFLAMSYMNLIPGCNTCNEKTNKGTLDPLTYPDYGSLLLNPHEFRESAVTFSYTYNHQGENNEKNYTVNSAAENVFLEQGYLKELKLREFYSHRTLDVKDMYRGFTKASSSMKKFLRRLGLKPHFLEDVEQSTLGYQLNDDEAPRRLMYKFKKDLLMQLRREYGI